MTALIISTSISIVVGIYFILDALTHLQLARSRSAQEKARRWFKKTVDPSAERQHAYLKFCVAGALILGPLALILLARLQ